MTLIELMVVVAIIGVIAVIAAVGYGRYTRTARMTEATDMIGSIKIAQENYFTQTNKYLNVSADINPPAMYPQQTPKNGAKVDWGTPCTWCKEDWSRLGMHASGKVAFGYAVVADSETCDPDCRGLIFTLPTTSTPLVWKNLAGAAVAKPWYVATAVADFDGDGKFSSVVGTSFSSQILSGEEP